MGMVGLTLWYFAGPDVPRYVRLTVGYTWFSSISIVMLVPADIWTVLYPLWLMLKKRYSTSHATRKQQLKSESCGAKFKHRPCLLRNIFGSYNLYVDLIAYLTLSLYAHVVALRNN
ncbi:hypothetical protein Leryth_006865 [Lithospermum erythrorhizon]|nr:hypothetical protein Leryth_006865 [Lithospermum erythrorhizon]